MGNPAEETTITRTITLKRKRAPSSRLPATRANYVLNCGWPERLVPVGEDLFGFLHFLFVFLFFCHFITNTSFSDIFMLLTGHWCHYVKTFYVASITGRI